MNVDVMTQIGAVERKVSERDHEGKARLVVSASRTYATSPDDLWEAITKPERLARWFGLVSGDLRLGGSFQIKGNAKGEVTACKPPERLGVTWTRTARRRRMDLERRVDVVTREIGSSQRTSLVVGGHGMQWELTHRPYRDHRPSAFRNT